MQWMRNPPIRPEQLSYRNHKIWQIVQRLLPNEREQRIAYLLYHCGFKPDEIVSSWPHEFADISEIAQLRRKIVELLRNGQLIPVN